MHAGIAGLYGFDFLHHVHALRHLAEHGVTPALRVFATVVEKGVIHGIDEELCGGRVRVAGARHGQGAGEILESVVGFVLDFGAGRFFLHAGGHAATLDHEAGDDTVKDRAIVETLVHVSEEIGRGLRSLDGIQFNFYYTQTRGHADLRIHGLGRLRGRHGKRQDKKCEQGENGIETFH